MKRQKLTYAQQLAKKRLDRYFENLELDSPGLMYSLLSNEDFVARMDREIEEAVERVRARAIAEAYATVPDATCIGKGYNDWLP